MKFLLLFVFSFCLQLVASEKPFAVLISSHNNRAWYQENLNSVFNQRYQNYRIIYIDDGSTDGTADLVEEYAKNNERFTLIRNKEANGPLACLCQGVYLCNKEEIVVDLNGNDWFAHDEVLSHLNKIYADPAVWMTYGQFLFYPQYSMGFAAALPPEVIEENRFRSFGSAVTHLQTFYAGLFQEIKKEDLLWDRKFISKAGDLAYSIPILEMAGSHVRFIPDVLYVYNRSYPLNSHKVSTPLEEEMDRMIRKKEKYAPLERLPHFEALPVYQRVNDPSHPTLHDYRSIQEFLSFDTREGLERLYDMQNGVRSMKIIGNSPEEFPRSGTIALGEEKENCVLLYATFNRNYPNALMRLLKRITESDFKGDVLYRLGGWPNTEGGSLALAHVPYAFKVSFFREAQRLGYKRALWLDVSVVPLVSLNLIFERIEKTGHFGIGIDRTLGPYMNPQAAAFFGLNHEQTYKITSCSAGLFGVDFTNARSRQILDWLDRAAHDKDAYFSARSDQNALSCILYLLGIDDLISMDYLPHSQEEIKPDSLFWLDREFAHGL